MKTRKVTIEVPIKMTDIQVRMAIHHAWLFYNEKTIKEAKTWKDIRVGTVFPAGYQGTTSGEEGEK